MAALLLLWFLAAAFAPLRAQVPISRPIPPPPAAASNAESASPARIEGRVVSLVGDPLRKANLRLQGMFRPPSPGSTQPPVTTNYTTTSDAEGNFVFEEIEPGGFTLQAERAGYVRASYGAKGAGQPTTQITLRPGQKMTGVLMTMTPQALIAGKVTDEDGDPFPAVSVQVHRVVWNQGRRQLQSMNAASSQPDGTFMIGNLAAGKYYLSATNNTQFRNMNSGTRERSGRKGPPEEYLTTYYPNALDSSLAAPVELTAGIDVRGIEIRMRKSRTFRLSGRVVNSSGASPVGAVLMLRSATSVDAFDLNRSTQFIRDNNGAFEFNYLLPGAYIITTQPGSNVRGPDGSVGPPLLGRLAVNLGNDDLDNLVMTLGPGGEISGQFILDGVGPLNAEARAKLASKGSANSAGASAPTRGGLPNLQLSVAEGFGFGAPNIQNKEDGSFTVKTIPPERYRLNTYGLPSGTYIKQIRYGGQDITHSLLDLTASLSGQLEIVLSPNAASISGVVQNEKGEPVKEIMVTISQRLDLQPGSQEFFRSLRTDAKGAFNLTGLAPGEYRVLAWEQVDNGMVTDPEFRAKFDSKATVVKLQENSRETIETKLLPLDAIEAEAAKIR